MRARPPRPVRPARSKAPAGPLTPAPAAAPRVSVRRRLNEDNRKTVQGTLAGLVATFLAAGSLLVLLLSRGGPAAIPSGSLRSVATACVVTALVEAFTDQLDNIFLPIVFMASL